MSSEMNVYRLRVRVVVLMNVYLFNLFERQESC